MRFWSCAVSGGRKTPLARSRSRERPRCLCGHSLCAFIASRLVWLGMITSGQVSASSTIFFLLPAIISMLAAWPVSEQLCWAGNESITHAWPFYRKGQGHVSLNWLDSLMRLMCFPCSLSLSVLCVGNWPWFLPLHLALLLSPLHCLQANVIYLKNLVTLIIMISFYCMSHIFLPLKPQVSLVLAAFCFTSLPLIPASYLLTATGVPPSFKYLLGLPSWIFSLLALNLISVVLLLLLSTSLNFSFLSYCWLSLGLGKL